MGMLLRQKSSNWSVCGHSKIGHRHVFNQTNGQDALGYQVLSRAKDEPELIVAVVCDGCSDSLHAEIGAKLLSHLIVSEFVQNYKTKTDRYINP